MAEPFKFDTLNTSFVNLAAFLRYLREKNFIGRMHVVLDQYEADVFLYGSDAPSVWENDHAANRESQGEAAMQRLLVRARDPGGVITLFEGSVTDSTPATEVVVVAETGVEPEPWQSELIAGADESDLATSILASAEVIGAVERAVESSGINFAELFYLVRVEIGDDYPILDPTVGGFEYAQLKVTLTAKPAATTYVQGVSEALKRVVNRVAAEKEESSFRERVAVELAMALRRLPDGVGLFMTQLDRIAGTRVI
jgi:hypothetical protein